MSTNDKIKNKFMIKDKYLDMKLSNEGDKNTYRAKHLLLILLAEYTNSGVYVEEGRGLKDRERTSLGGEAVVSIEGISEKLNLTGRNNYKREQIEAQLKKLKGKSLIEFSMDKKCIKFRFTEELIPNYEIQKELYTWIPRDLVYGKLTYEMKERFKSKHVMLCIALLRYRNKKKSSYKNIKVSLNQLGEVLEVDCSKNRNTITRIIDECIAMGVIQKVSGGFKKGMSNVKEVNRYEVLLEDICVIKKGRLKFRKRVNKKDKPKKKVKKIKRKQD